MPTDVGGGIGSPPTKEKPKKETGQGGKGVTERPAPPAPRTGAGEDQLAKLDRVAARVLKPSPGELQLAQAESRPTAVYPSVAPVNQFDAPPVIFQDTTQPIEVLDDPVLLNTLNERSNAIPREFAQAHPAEAASLLISAIPTDQLGAVVKTYNEAIGFVGRQTTMADVPYFLVPYYKMAFNAPDPERRVLALQFLDQVREQPPTEQYAFMQAHITEFSSLTHDYSAMEFVNRAAGGILMAGPRLIGEAGRGTMNATGLAAGAVGWERGRELIDTAHEAIGNAATAGGEYFGYGVRVLEGTAATSLRYGLIFPAVVGALQGGEFNPAETFTRYVPTWDEYHQGQHSGATQLLFDMAGLDINEYNNFASLFDMAVDVGATVGVMRLLSGVRTNLRTPTSMGGWIDGERFIQSRPGKTLLDRFDALDKVPENQRVAKVIETAPRTPLELAKRIAQAATREDRARAIADYGDHIPKPAEFAAVKARDAELAREAQALERGDPAYPTAPSGEAPVKEWFDWQDATVERIPKELRANDTGINAGMSLEQAMDLGREVALKGEKTAADLSYAAEKIASLRRSIEAGRLGGVTEAESALVSELLNAFREYAGAKTPLLTDIESLVRAIIDNDAGLAGRILTDIETRLSGVRAEVPTLSAAQLKRIAELTDSEGGTTYNLNTGKFYRAGKDEGFPLGATPDERVLYITPEEWANVRIRNRLIREHVAEHPELSRSDVHLGTWRDPANGVVNVGPSELFATEAEAFAKGAARGERFTYNLKTGEDVPIPPPELPVMSPRMVSILAERAALGQKVMDMDRQLRAPLWEWPRVSRLSEVAYGIAPGNVGAVLNFLFHDALGKAGLDLRKLFDDLSPKDQILYNPQFKDIIPGALEHNYRSVRINLRMAGVDEATQRVLIDQMMKVRTRGEFYDWRVDLSSAIEEAITHGGTRYLRKATQAEIDAGLANADGMVVDIKAIDPMAAEAIKFSNRTAEDAALAPYHVEAIGPDGVIVRELHNVAENAHGRAIPTQGNELIAHTSLPAIEVMRSASSTMRYYDMLLKSKPGYGKIYGAMRVPVDVARFMVLSLPRLIMKPTLLVVRTIPMGLKIQIDQGLREFALGMRPLDVWKRHNIDMGPGGIPLEPGIRANLPKNTLAEPDVSALGVLRETPMLDAETVRYSIPTRNIDVNLEPQTVISVSHGIYDQLTHLNGSELARTVALRGGAETLRYIREHPQSTVAAEWAELAPDVLKTQTAESFFRNKEAQIFEVTSGRPDLMRAVATGKWREAADAKVLSQAQERIRVENEGLATLVDRAKQARLRGDKVEQAEVARRIDEVEHRIETIGKTAEDSGASIHISNKTTMTAKLREEWANGTYKPPANVYVERRLGPRTEDVTPSGIMGKVHRTAARMSNTIYSGLRPLGEADLQLTRGSMFYQEFARINAQLMRAGYTKDMAHLVAQYRAAFNVRDLMYDLSARSSFDRATKDVFWFAPVLREQLTTWLFKIPNESYWVAGMPLMWGGMKNILDDMDALGVTRHDANGDLLVKLPVFSELIGKLIGQPLEFRLDSINPVTPGGSKMYPTAQPGVEAILEFGVDHAPKSVQGLITTLNNIFTFDEGDPGVSWIPNGVSAMLTALGVNVPYKDQWNPTMWRNADRLAEVQSIQWAISDLASEGVKAPLPGAPQEEWDAYKLEVEHRAENYRGGLRVVRFISNVVSPMSIVTMPPAAAAYYKWREDQGFSYPYTDADYAKIDEYVRAHPQALPYTIGRYATAEDPLLPDDAPFADKIEAGDLIPYSGDEYYIKAWTVMGMAAEEARVRQELRGAGLGSASSRIANAGRYNTIMAEHLIRLDDWFRANPEVEVYLDSRNDLKMTPTEERALEASRLLKELEQEGVLDGVGSKEIGAVRAALFKATEDIVWGPPGSEVERQMNWWYDEVYDGYRAKVDPLYARAEALFQSGQDNKAFKVLGKVRDINNEYAGGADHNGEHFVSPEEYSFYRKGPRQRVTTTLDWTFSRPTSLSEFQMDTTGLPSFEGRDLLTAGLAAEDDRYFDAISNPHLTDAQREALDREHLARIESLGATYGPQGAVFSRLSAGTPADRLAYANYGQGNWYWEVLYGEAQQIIAYARSQGSLSSSRYASTTMGIFQRKVEFERKVQLFRELDPELDKLFRQLEPATAAHGDERRMGVPLYEYLYFGQSENAYNYQDPLVAAVERTP